jgi:transposase
VAFEVCTQAQWVASIVRPLAVEVQVANASRIPWLFRDGRKNDRLDARKLATLLYLDQLPTVHLPTAQVSGWRALINYRRSLVNGRTRIRNRIRSILRSFGRRCPHRSCWTRKGMTWLTAQVFDDTRNLMMHHLLDELNGIAKQVISVQARLGEIAELHPGVALLQTVPGIGPRSAEAIIAFGDQVQRFRNRKHFTSYFGMTPTEDSSGMVVRRGRISKRGPSVVRWVLIEAARSAVRHDPSLRSWYERIHKGRPDRRKKAVVATGRKILSICYGMLRTGEVFDAKRVATRPAA